MFRELPLIFVLVSSGCSLIVDGESGERDEEIVGESDSCSESSYFVGHGSDDTDCSDGGTATDDSGGGSATSDGGSVADTGTGGVDSGSGGTGEPGTDDSSSGSVSEELTDVPTASSSGTGSDTVSETSSASESVEEDFEWCDAASGLCWEAFAFVEDIPPPAPYSTISYRCSSKGMRIPTAEEVRTLFDNCASFFLPGCAWDDEFGYPCVNTEPLDKWNCRGPIYQIPYADQYNEYFITSSAPTNLGGPGTYHAEWFLSLDWEADPPKFPELKYKRLVNGGPSYQPVKFTTMCVR